MKIDIVKSKEDKGNQQRYMVWNCRNHWSKFYDTNFSDYTDIMNMRTYRFNDEHQCSVAITYHQEPNKW